MQARFVSPFALELASMQPSDARRLQAAPTRPSLQPIHPPIKPSTHEQMVHRLSKEFSRDSSTIPSMPAGNRLRSESCGSFRSTHAQSTPSRTDVKGREASRRSSMQKSDTSAWDALVRYQSVEPTASQLSVTQTQQAMFLMGRTESIRDRHHIK